MQVTISAEHNDARLAASSAFFHTGGTPRFEFYAGAKPATHGATPGGALLGEIDLPEPCAEVSGHVLVLVVPQDGLCVASGTIGFARFVNGAGNAAVDLDITTSGGGGAVIVDNLTVFEGGTIRLTYGVLG